MSSKRASSAVDGVLDVQRRTKQRRKAKNTCGQTAKAKKTARTLTRSARQGGLLETLILGNQPETTVRRLWSDDEDALLRQAVKRIGA